MNLVQFILTHEALTQELDLSNGFEQELFGMPSKTFSEVYRERIDLIEHCIYQFIESIPKLTGTEAVALIRDTKYILNTLREREETADMFHRNGRNFIEILESLINFAFEYMPNYEQKG